MESRERGKGKWKVERGGRSGPLFFYSCKTDKIGLTPFGKLRAGRDTESQRENWNPVKQHFL